MLAPLVLPFQLTLILSVVIFCAIRMARNTARGMGIYFLALLVLFVPSCTGVMLVVNEFRYGWFHFDRVNEIRDRNYIDLPVSATDIDLFRSYQGHVARFHVPSDELLRWIDAKRSSTPDLNTPPMESRISHPELLSETEKSEYAASFQHWVAPAKWDFDSKMVRFEVQFADDGGGYTIWHVPGSDLAYLHAGYW